MEELRVERFDALDGVADRLTPWDACVYCAGAPPIGTPEAGYRHVTLDLTLHVARVFAARNPHGRFLYVSGAHADTDSRFMQLRIKGETEAALRTLPIVTGMLRPGAMRPVHGERSQHAWMRPLYALRRRATLKRWQPRLHPHAADGAPPTGCPPGSIGSSRLRSAHARPMTEHDAAAHFLQTINRGRHGARPEVQVRQAVGRAVSPQNDVFSHLPRREEMFGPDSESARQWISHSVYRPHSGSFDRCMNYGAQSIEDGHKLKSLTVHGRGVTPVEDITICTLQTLLTLADTY